MGRIVHGILAARLDAVSERRQASVLANNRAEGNASLTMQARGEILRPHKGLAFSLV